MMARAARAGQFVIVMPHEQGERVPLTIADLDRDNGTITLVIQAVGKTMREMQQLCKVGARLHAVVGPMGIPSPERREKGDLRRRRPGRGSDLSPGACFQGERRIRDRIPPQGSDVWTDKFSACCDELPRSCNSRNDSLCVRPRSPWPMPLEALPVDHRAQPPRRQHARG